MAGYDVPMQPHGAKTGREPWMMNAAQNLAFLKHGSPTLEKSTAQIPHEAEVASMPSLAASSSDTSPEDQSGEPGKRAPEKECDPNSSTVNSLLMAAMAMTEFQSRNEPRASSEIIGAGKDQLEAQQVIQNDRPEVSKVFRPSPKRKSADKLVEDSISIVPSGSQGPGEGAPCDGISNSHCAAQVFDETTRSPGPADARSPLDPRDLKRTRLGSVRKKMNWEKAGEGGKKANSPESLLKEKAPLLETPNQKQTFSADILTPVSARCIDFKKIRLSSSSPALSGPDNGNKDS